MIFSKAPLIPITIIPVTKALILGLAMFTLTSCASTAGGQNIQLDILARSQNCDVPRSEPYWLRVKNRGDLPAAFSAVENSGPFWLIGLGNKPTGGYSINIAPQATLQGSTLRVETTTTSPDGRVVSQAFTNPCLLLAASAGFDITESHWLENGTARIVPVQPYRATNLRLQWQ